MWPRRTSAEKGVAGEPNRAAFRKRVKKGPPPGLLAYEDGEPIGWVAIAPRREYRRFETSRVLQPVDDQEVWSVPCFFIARGHRKKGVTKALLGAACEWAGQQGAKLIEGYPIDTRGKEYTPAFAWHGLIGTFEAAGFTEVARRSKRRPIMRRTVRAKRKSRG